MMNEEFMQTLSNTVEKWYELKESFPQATWNQVSSLSRDELKELHPNYLDGYETAIGFSYYVILIAFFMFVFRGVEF